MQPVARVTRIVWLDPCPESVWELLPGGPDIWNDTYSETWQYMGTIPEEGGRHRHEFRHRAHPDYGSARVYAHVADDDAGPRLSRLVAAGRELPLPPMAVPQGGDPKEEVEDLAGP